MTSVAHKMALAVVSAVLGMTLLAGCSTPERLLVLALFTLGVQSEVSAPMMADVAPADLAAYGAKVRYQQGKPLSFPDLTLEFRGERQVDAGPRYPRGFVYHDFRARQGDEVLDVSWSAGTGDIGPTVFEFAGRTYRLELRQSDKLGRLADDELVLWQD